MVFHLKLLLGRDVSVAEVRESTADWQVENQNKAFEGKTLEEWITAENGSTFEEHIKGVRNDQWGGLTEMMAISRIFNVAFEVLQLLNAGDKYWYQCILLIGASSAVGTVSALYRNGIHYDAALPDVSSKISLTEAIAKTHAFSMSKKASKKAKKAARQALDSLSC